MYNKYGIYSEMRPPVVAEDLNSPLRGHNAYALQMYANIMRDPQNCRLTRDQFSSNLTSDGKLADKRWNDRHHISPTTHNSKNTTYHKAFFDKEVRANDRKKIK